ncbi:MAG TPA: precorrin-6y C5,15-methyltransferase (decarboxylating) subunit CbiE [Desulfotignum sp.]|nr:precorrin-6y C5,15-methyltransferase (decarboxylating) subunit CbiE [Desulfotignum sp.]
MMKPVYVIGIGQGKEDLTTRQLDIIANADILVGGQRLLNLFFGHKAERLVIDRHIDRVIRRIKDEMVTRQVVVLASGDPLFYGIGTTLLTHIDKNHIQILSNVSCVAAAFAAIKEPWHDARIISLHGKSMDGFSFSGLAWENRVAFLTSPKKDPGFIARNLLRENVSGFGFCVLENIGYTRDRKITWFHSYAEVMSRNFSHPNMVILLRNKDLPANVSHETYLGMEDNLFQHAGGLITKSEIRSISLSRLKLVKKDHILWDIGSGSGSVSIEAALAIPKGSVFAIEKNRHRTEDIFHNIKKFRCPNIQVVPQAFPDGAHTLPPPDRVFVGGGGRHLDIVLEAACDHLMETGIIVINTVLIQNMERAFTFLENKQFSPAMVQVQVSRSQAMPFGNRLESLNPVWIISGTKPMS